MAKTRERAAENLCDSDGASLDTHVKTGVMASPGGSGFDKSISIYSDLATYILLLP